MRRPTGQLYKRFGGRDLKPDDPHEATFYLRYEVEGRRHTICLGTKDCQKARTLADDHLGRIDRTDREAYLRSLVTLGKLAEAELAGRSQNRLVVAADKLWDLYEASRRRPQSGPGTMEGYRAQVKRFAAWAHSRQANAATLAAEHAERYVKHLEGAGITNYTIRKHIATLARVWRVLMPEQANPWAGLAPAGEERHTPYRRLAPEELRALAARAREAGNEEHLLVLLGYYTGMRIADAATLDAGAYAARKGTLTLVPAKTAKRKPAPIVIPVMAELAEAMERAPREGPLMPRICVQQSGRGDELSKRMARMIREAGEGDTQAGKASFHSLRATFISMMDEAGAPQAVTDSITGHAPQTMHARYSHPDTEAARNWMEKALPRLDTHLDTV